MPVTQCTEFRSCGRCAGGHGRLAAISVWSAVASLDVLAGIYWFVLADAHTITLGRVWRGC